jgi:hypothetical protein
MQRRLNGAGFAEKQVPCQRLGLDAGALFRNTEPPATPIQGVAADSELVGGPRHVAIALADSAQQLLALAGLKLAALA